MANTAQPAVKDNDTSHPIASAWRDTLTQVVDALVAGDYQLQRGVPNVAPISAAVAQQIREYLVEYGETLARLPEETWHSSVAQWMDGHWDVLVDLWTKESGESDLVLSAQVFEDAAGGFRFKVNLVSVP